jgi:carbon monoxide dehydrogenase subunit G
MKLEQSFEVAAPLEQVWRTLVDVEHVAPCLPGAAVTGRNEDGSYNGTFTVKIGPTTASYTGKLEMENIDEASHTATMNAQGTDKRGQGGAKATILSRLAPADGQGTRVEVVTDYHITGRLARFGRGGMIEDISERLLREFAKRLQSSLAAQPETDAAPAAAAAAEAAGAEAAAAAEAAGEEARAAAEAAGADAAAAAEAAAAEHPGTEPASTESMRSADTVVSRVPELPPSPTTASGMPQPPSPTAPREEPAPPAAHEESAPPAAQQESAPPAPEPPPHAPPPPAPEPPPVMPPPPPSAEQTPPLENPPMPSEPMQGLSLISSVVWGRVKRNPAPVAAAGVAVVLLMARRRRRRHGH